MKTYCKTGKRYFPTERDAEESLKNLRRHFADDNSPKPTRVYHCPECNGYHFTSKQESKGHRTLSHSEKFLQFMQPDSTTQMNGAIATEA